MGTNIFIPCNLTFIENVHHSNNFWTVTARALIFHMSILWDQTFPWVLILFYPWHLTLVYFFVENFSKMMARFFIFHIIILCQKIFLLKLGLTLTFDLFFLKSYIIHNKILNISALILLMSICCDKIFLLVSRCMSLWSWSSLKYATLGGICVSQTHHICFQCYKNIDACMKAKTTVSFFL